MAGVTLGLVYAVAASYTRPFTLGADAVTAVPLLGAAVVVALGAARAGARGAGDPRTGVAGGSGPWWRVWLVLGAAVVAWELYCYVSGPRPAYPTLSSLLDKPSDAHRAGKAAAFGAWLSLGWYLVR